MQCSRVSCPVSRAGLFPCSFSRSGSFLILCLRRGERLASLAQPKAENIFPQALTFSPGHVIMLVGRRVILITVTHSPKSVSSCGACEEKARLC